MQNRWNDVECAALPDFDGLLYASRLTGADTDLVVWGGGNTSVKRTEIDYRGRTVRVLRVKGSGSDLKAAQVRDFPGVRLDDLESLRPLTTMSDEAMVAFLGHAVLEPGSARPSIETLLHAFLPATFIIHTHADAILALTNTPHGARWVAEVLGPTAVWVPYVRPGFGLAQSVSVAVAAHAGATCVVLEKHGLVTWGETARAAYDATIDACRQAEDFVATRRGLTTASMRDVLNGDARAAIFATVAPLIRSLYARTLPIGEVASTRTGVETRIGDRTVLLLDDCAEARTFAINPDAPRLSQIGPATPDHLVTTRRSPVFVPIDADALLTAERPEGRSIERVFADAIEAALPDAWNAWTRNYVDYVSDGAIADPGTPRPTTLDPRPRVVLLPGVGMVTLGRDVRATRIVADVYRHALRVVRDAETVEAFTSLSGTDCYGVEFWPMELYKLTLAPPEASLARRIAFVTGGASGIGRAIAERLAREGAHVVVADVDFTLAKAVADLLCAQLGVGRAVAVACDVTRERSVTEAVETTVRTFGGLDILVSNAGIAPSSPVATMSLAMWQQSFDVNATGHFLVTRAALQIMQAQGTGGSIVYVTTKNVMAPGRDFAAYSAAKAAQAQLARVVAMEAGAFGIRVNMINPDAVFRNSGLWAPEVRQNRADAHGIAPAELEDFYRKRNLLGVTIDPDDVAEIAWWLASDRSRKTTGTVITVDGGVPAGFPR